MRGQSRTVVMIGLAVLAELQASGQEPSPPRNTEFTTLEQQVAELAAGGKYSEALPLATKLLDLREKALGPNDRGTAASCNQLGELFFRAGDYAHAEPILERALSLEEKALGPDDPRTAKTLNILAELYLEEEDLGKAEPLFHRALSIREKALGADNLDTGETVADLSELYRKTGNYAKAEPLSIRALKIYEKAAGPEHPDTATVLNNQSALYSEMGDYPKAEKLLQRALKISEKTLGPDHPDVAFRLNNLAVLYVDNLGDYVRAEPLYLRALKIRETALGPEHLSTAVTVSNLASCYESLHQLEKAEALYQRALRIEEKILPEHSATAMTMNNLGQLDNKLGQSKKAEELLRRALKIHEKAEGSEHPDTSLVLQNLAWLYVGTGDYEQAESLYRRALEIDEKVLGSDHSDTERVLRNLAALSIDQGKTNEAFALGMRAGQAGQKGLASVLSFTSEQQRLAFANMIAPFNVLGTLGRASELAELVLRYKGVVLDSLLEDRLIAEASEDPHQREVVADARALKQRLMKLLLETPKDLSEAARRKRDADKDQLSKRVEELEAGLARQFSGLGKARRALGVTVAQVQKTLPNDHVLIEFLLYNHYLGKNKSEPRYGAVIITARSETKWIPLGSVVEVAKNTALYQKSARGKTDGTTLNRVLRALHAQVWEPIEKALPAETRTVIISPDGELSFVSFATLLSAEDKFLAEKYSVRYVASGRDLLRENQSSGNSATVIYANPDFGSNAATSGAVPATVVAARSAELRNLQSISLPFLPGTAAEAAALEKRAGQSTKLFLGSNATEAELRKVNSPRVLHLATHGFFLPEIDSGKSNDPSQLERDIPKGKLVNPMHRSGLALAGAQTTLQAWARGEVPSTENDGIVTAEEVGGLKLDGTELVVLSACETGSGEARAGEGVMGLRRGFVQAGAKNLLMTLWPISDETTVKIMLDFYEAADKSKNAPQALAKVQRDWLVKLRQERSLLTAVNLAGPFIMSSQGPP